MTDLGILNVDSSQASGINNNGDIVVNISAGSAYGVEGYGSSIYSTGTRTMTGLNQFANAMSINDSGQVVGVGQSFNSLLYPGPTLLPLSPVAINNNGQIAAHPTTPFPYG